MKPISFDFRTLMTMLTVAAISCFSGDAFGQVSDFNNTGCTTPAADAAGNCSVALGNQSSATGSTSIAIGGDDASASGDYSHVFGLSSASGEYSFAIGTENVSAANYSQTFGHLLKTEGTESYNMVIGFGDVGSQASFTNDISNSIMIGANSTKPTMFIENAGGGIKLGRVGIGTTDPDGILHIVDESNTDTKFIIEKAEAEEGSIIFDNNGTQLASINFNPGEDLEIENTVANNDIRFRVSDGTVAEIMRVDGSSQAVGIGVTNPSSILDVEARGVAGTENVARFTVADASNSERVVIGNRTGTNGEFAGMITGFSDVTDQPALTLRGYASNDTGTQPVVLFQARDNNDITTRPIFSWRGQNATYMQMDANGNLGIGTTSPAFLLELDDNSAGKPGNAFWDVVSDIEYKTDIQSFDVGLEVIEQINPIKFRYTGNIGLPTDEEFVGVSAQEVQQVAPYMVKFIQKVDTTNGSIQELLSYNPNALLYVVVNSLKDLKRQNDTLRQRTSILEEELASALGQIHQCCTDSQSKSANQSNGESNQGQPLQFILDQNDPNPFVSSTVIDYMVPSTTNTASLVLFDSTGRTVNQFELAERGIGSLTVYGSEISTGIYYYSLILDGVVVDTKRLVRTQ